MTDVCDTCAGTGRVDITEPDNGDSWTWNDKPCPDCAGGEKLRPGATVQPSGRTAAGRVVRETRLRYGDSAEPLTWGLRLFRVRGVLGFQLRDGRVVVHVNGFQREEVDLLERVGWRIAALSVGKASWWLVPGERVEPGAVGALAAYVSRVEGDAKDALIAKLREKLREEYARAKGGRAWNPG